MVEPYLELEHRWAEWNRLRPKNMVACSSGTAALHLALEAIGQPGECVVVPDFTMIACARAVKLANQTPVFIDCDSRLLVSPELIPQYCNTVMAVHIYGRRCDMDSIHSTGKKVIEDMSEIHGTHPHPSTDAACWSFYKNKIVGGEEGGAVYFKDRENAELARKLRSLGFTDEHDFMHIPRGHNYRMSNAHAKLILNSVDTYTVRLNRKRTAEGWYDRNIPEEWRMPKREQPWVYDLRIPGLQREEQDYLVRQMRSHGARHGFKPMSIQPEFRCSVHNPNSYNASREIIYFPLSIATGVQTVVKKLRYEVEHLSKRPS